LSTGGPTIDTESRISTRSFAGDLVIRLRVTTSAGSWETEHLVPAGDGACRGRCELPERTWYRVALADVEVHTGMCGSDFGECDPPTRTVAAGTATFSLDWEQGTSNGSPDWSISDSEDATVDTVVPDFPRLDLGGAGGGWALSDPTVARPLSDATLRVRVDRAVDFRLMLLQPFEPHDAPGVPATTCDGSAELSTSGTSTRIGAEEWIEASFVGLCLGRGYAVRLELTDEAGGTSVYQPWDGPGATWSGSYIEAPDLVADVAVTLAASAYEGRVYLREVNVSLNGLRILSPAHAAARCLVTGEVAASAEDTVYLQTENTVTIRLHIVASWPTTGSTEEWATRCYAGRHSNPMMEIITTVTLAELVDGVRIRAGGRETDSVDVRLTLSNIRSVP
jgi:hypothetical protein